MSVCKIVFFCKFICLLSKQSVKLFINYVDIMIAKTKHFFAPRCLKAKHVEEYDALCLERDITVSVYVLTCLKTWCKKCLENA